eukprot:scaffold444_cov109-Cylindrotheca_fusiformis.AAC.2
MTSTPSDSEAHRFRGTLLYMETCVTVALLLAPGKANHSRTGSRRLGEVFGQGRTWDRDESHKKLLHEMTLT